MISYRTYGYLFSMALLVLIQGCVVEGAVEGKVSVDQSNSLTRSSVLPVNDPDCPNGGILMETGVDDNGNGVLDADEVTSTKYICQTGGTLSDNARLNDIFLSSGALEQLFQPSQTEYTATVGYLITSLSVTASTEDEQASLSVNGVTTPTGT